MLRSPRHERAEAPRNALGVLGRGEDPGGAAAGDFEQLEGHGKPIPGLDAPYDPLWWVKKLLEREKLSVLPLALEVRANVHRAVAAIWSLPRETEVRERVTAINAEIGRANRTTADGPPTTLAPLDVDEILAEWRRRRRSAE
jgi:hypothetical protein